MPYASSISPERRARLRHLRSEFEAAFDLVADREDRSSPAYQAADACYRAWIGALDGVALALLDDLDACEAACADTSTQMRAGVIPPPNIASPADINLILWGREETQSAADLIGATRTPIREPRKNTPKSRAMSVIGADRVARHWSISLGRDRPVHIPEDAR